MVEIRRSSRPSFWLCIALVAQAALAPRLALLVRLGLTILPSAP